MLANTSISILCDPFWIMVISQCWAGVNAQFRVIYVWGDCMCPVNKMMWHTLQTWKSNFQVLNTHNFLNYTITAIIWANTFLRSSANTLYPIIFMAFTNFFQLASFTLFSQKWNISVQQASTSFGLFTRIISNWSTPLSTADNSSIPRSRHFLATFGRTNLFKSQSIGLLVPSWIKIKLVSKSRLHSIIAHCQPIPYRKCRVVSWYQSFWLYV